MTVLVDATVLIALTVTTHIHHELIETWFLERTDAFATCPVTQDASVRFLLRSGGTTRDPVDVLPGLDGAEGSTFWADHLGHEAVDLRGVVGHRQVADAYLAALARSHGGRLASSEHALAVMHDDVATLLPADGCAPLRRRPTPTLVLAERRWGRTPLGFRPVCSDRVTAVTSSPRAGRRLPQPTLVGCATTGPAPRRRSRCPGSCGSRPARCT